MKLLKQSSERKALRNQSLRGLTFQPRTITRELRTPTEILGVSQSAKYEELQVTVSMMLLSLVVIVPLIPTLAYTIHKVGE